MGNCQSQSMLQHALVPVLGKLGPVSELRIVNSLWLRDYQGLFDYDSKQIKRSIISVKEDSCTLFVEDGKRVKKQLLPNQASEQIMKNAIFQVVKRSNYFMILPINIQNEQYTIQKLLWLAVRTVPGQKYPIKEKDVLKFGKLRIKVRQIVLYEGNASEITNFNYIKASKKIYDEVRINHNQDLVVAKGKDIPSNEIISMATESQSICRICLQVGQNHNPLICACKCTGSVKYVHLLCLRTWLGKQLNINKNKHCISIKWTPLSCQMCKGHYKYRIYLDGQKYYTVEIPKPSKPYIVLEVMKKSQEYSKIFHFVSMAENSKLSIGRRKDIDIKLAEDISVSRHHANLLYDFEGKRFMLEDNKSKFGTLVLIKKNMLANPFQRGISFQMGGQLFTFECTRGQGSIPDYFDQDGYLNVVERNDKKRAESEESDQGNQDDDDYDDGEEDPNLLQYPALNIQNNSGMSNGSQGLIPVPSSPIQLQPQSQPVLQPQAPPVEPVRPPSVMAQPQQPVQLQNNVPQPGLQVQNLDD